MIEASRYKFTAQPDKIGPHWNVRVSPPICQSETVVSDFATEADARTWIDEDSADWVEHLEASRR